MVAPNPFQRRNLFGKATKPRFELRDRDWPVKVGDASICLWKDDAVAAASTGVDDNCAANLPWWLDMCKKYGLRPTWWLITGNVNGKNANGGTWDAWKKVLAAGCDVQSHTVNHLHTESPTWKNMETEYADSQKTVNANVPGARCLTLAYPGGKNQALNDPALAAKYYIAGRTGVATINPANAIDYLQVHATSAFNISEAKFPGGNLVTVFEKSPKNVYWRGWWVGFFHWIKTDDAAQIASCEKRFTYIQGKVQSGELWLGLFREVAMYGQERDTSRLEVKSVAPDKIVFTLTDEMDDTLFDFPLTVKVRLDLDAYGGSKSIPGQATEWFALQQLKGRWWLVTPEGHGMISLGVVHIMATATLPIYEAAYHSDQTALTKDVADNLRRWGFNSAGYGAVWKSRDQAMMSELPLMVSLEDLLGISRFSKTPERLDLFDESVRETLANRIAQHVNPVKNAKKLIGYFYVDLPLWWNQAARKKENDWAIAYRKLTATAPGKVQYVDFLLTRHKVIAAINQAYGTSATDRAGLLAETAWANVKPDAPTVMEDDKAFVVIVARKYYQLCHDEIRKLDPHHLIFGDRYAGTDLLLLESVLTEAAPYLDGVAIQPFDRDRYNTELYDKIAAITGKPILFCDFAVNFSAPKYPNGMWGSWPTEDQAADVWSRYLDDAFGRPYMVGIHRCEYIDLPREKVLKQGLIQQDGRPYARTVQRYAEIHKKLYQRMYGGKPGE